MTTTAVHDHFEGVIRCTDCHRRQVRMGNIAPAKGRFEVDKDVPEGIVCDDCGVEF